MNRILTLLLIPIVAISCNQPSAPAQETGPDYSAAIDSTVQAMQEVQIRTAIPGLSVSVMKDGEIVFSKGFGVSDLEAGTPVDPATTLFRIGSVSKSMSSIAMAVLYEEGKLDFDAPIQQYVASFPEKEWPVTVKQIAGHIGGVRHYRGNEMMSNVYYPTVEEGLDIFKDDPLLFEPGTDYSYSSYGWNLLSAAVEGASGEDFLEYMQTKVFDPIGLENTYAEKSTETYPGKTKYYVLQGSVSALAPEVDNSYKWAGGGFIASSEDLVKFGQTMIDATLLKQSTIDLLTTSLMVNDTSATNYGIGWRNQVNDFGMNWIGHSGGSVGGITQLVIFPKENIVVGLTSNSSNVDYAGVQHQIAAWFAAADE